MPEVTLELKTPGQLLDDICVLEADLARLKTTIQEACDLLAERKHGSPARSPGHNARLLLERALRAVTNGDRGSAA